MGDVIGFKRKGRYEVYDNGELISQHNEEHTAKSKAATLKIKSPKNLVEIKPPSFEAEVNMGMLSFIMSSNEGSGGDTPVIPPVSESLFAPILTNFRIDSTTPTRVYFDSPLEPITATDATGFEIGNKAISSININSGQTIDHYFTVSVAFNFWDNNSIRYDGGGNLKGANNKDLYNFTLDYISHNFTEPATSGTIYYLKSDGSDAANGLTEVNAFATLQHAYNTSVSGDEIRVKAGLWLNFPRTTGKGGVKLIGYKTTPGDLDGLIPNNTGYYSYTEGSDAPALSSTEMPLFDGNDTNTTGLIFETQDYFIVKNIQIQKCTLNFVTVRGIGQVFDNCIAKGAYGGGAEEGVGFDLGGIQTNGDPMAISKIRLTNSLSINSEISEVGVYGSGNLLDNVSTYHDDETGDGLTSTDYFITIFGDYNVVLNSRAVAKSALFHSASHGIGAKTSEFNYPDFGITTTYNLFQGCYVKSKSQEGYFSRNHGADYNVFKDCEVEGFDLGGGSYDGTGISNQTGARNNIYERIKGNNLSASFIFTSGSESGTDPNLLKTNGNIIRNSVFSNCTYAMRFDRTVAVLHEYKDNKIYNCTFDNIVTFARGTENNTTYFDLSGNEMKNCIVHGVTNKDHDASGRQPTLDSFIETANRQYNDYWNFWGTNGVAEAGTGNISIDPNFAADYVPQNTGLNIGLSLLKDDYLEVERRTDDTDTIGFKTIE